MSGFRKKPDNSPRASRYSYYKSSKTDLNRKTPARNTNKATRFLRYMIQRMSIFRILVVLTGLTLSLYLMNASTDPIVRFSLSSASARETSVYRQQIQYILKGSLFNHSKLLFDYRGVEESIKQEFPEIEAVEISFDLVGRRPVIKLFMLKPAYIFQTNGLAWVIDQRGIAIGLQSELRGSFTLSLQTITDEVGSSAAIGTVLMSSKQTNFLRSVIELLEKQQVVVTDVFVPGSPKELDLKIASDSWRYKLNIEEKPSTQAGTLLAAQATLILNGDVPVEYVDIRTSEKVYWR